MQQDYLSRCFPTMGQSVPGFCSASRIFIVPRQIPVLGFGVYRAVPDDFFQEYGFCFLSPPKPSF
jgi:hypothetical protein